MQTNNVRIDRLTQGPDGHEHVVARLSVSSHDFLWMYVESSLPDDAPPRAEYFTIINGTPHPGTRVPLGPPTKLGDRFRFSVPHFQLSPATSYLFHVADSLQMPTAEDAWEIRTLPAAELFYAESL